MKTKGVCRRILWVLGLVTLVLLFAACEGAGAGDDDDGDDPGNGASGDVTADLSGVVELIFGYIEEDSGFHDKQIDLLWETTESGSTTSVPLSVGFGVWDQDGTTPFPEEFTYSLDTTTSNVRRLGAIEFFQDLESTDNGDGTQSVRIGFGVTEVPLQELESDFEADGSTIEFDTYHQAVDGSVTVSKSGNEYTISFAFELDNGSTASGSYTGTASGEVDPAVGPGDDTVTDINLDQTYSGDFRWRGDYDWYRLPNLGNGLYAIYVDDEWSGFVGDPGPSDTLVEVYADDGNSPPQGSPIVEGAEELNKMDNPVEFTVETGPTDIYIKLYSSNPGPDSHELTVSNNS